MKLSSLIYAFVTLMGALAEKPKGDKDQVPSPLVTIKVTLQCRGDDCDKPPSTPVLTQMKNDVLNQTSPANYPPDSTESKSYGRTVGEITLNKTLAGTKDFRVNGDHLFKTDNQETHPGELGIQTYNLACTVALPSKPLREDMHQEAYEFDLQGKMEGGKWDLGDDIKVRCWKSLPSRTSETDRWSRGDATLLPFQLKIGERCSGEVEECKKSSGRTLPIVSWMKDGLMIGTSVEDIYCDISKEPRASGGDMIQVAHFDFNHPTLDDKTQLPLPQIFTIGNFEGEGQKTIDCEIRILNKPVLKTDLIQAGQLHSMGYFDINSKEPGGGIGYCYETILSPE